MTQFKLQPQEVQPVPLSWDHAGSVMLTFVLQTVYLAVNYEQS